MKIKPTFQLTDYDTKEVLKVRDVKKQKLYISNGLYPCDIFVDSEGRLIMYFKKKTLT